MIFENKRPYPTDRIKRERLRAHLIQQWREQAEQTARVGFSSLRCASMGLHEGQERGCTNVSGSCLCECHDAKVPG